MFLLSVLLGLVPLRPGEAAGGYVGAGICGQCHSSQHASWLGTPHATAYERLQAVQRHADPECIACHVTGFGQPTGFHLGDLGLGGVGCEACHGPGRRHARRPEPENIIGRPARRICETCHTTEQSPGFEERFASMLAEVDHGVVAEAAGAAGAETEPTGDEPMVVELFVMPHCPYGMEAESVLADVMREFGDDIDFRLHFIAEVAGEAGHDSGTAGLERRTDRPACEGVPAGGSGRFRSLHGDEEVAEGIRQVAAMALYPDRYLDFILCRNKAIHRDNWAACARAAGMDPVRIDVLASSEDGQALFAENIQRGNALGIRASPTLRMGGSEIQAVFDKAAWVRRICRDSDTGEPCADLPECEDDRDCRRPGKVGMCIDAGGRNPRCQFSDPVPFEMVVLNDADCAVCETGHVVRSTLELFPGARIRTVQVASPEGQALVRLHGIDRVPSFVMGDAFDRAARFPRFERRTRRTAGGYVADAGIVPVAMLLGREAQPGRTDLCLETASAFALRSALGVLQWARSERPADRLRVHYLPQMEGPLAGEAPYDLCVGQLFPDRYLDFVACRLAGALESADGRSSDACARLVGVDIEAVRRCVTDGEGDRLLVAERQWIETSGVPGGSVPLMLVVDNRFVVGPAMLPRIDEWVRRLSADGVGPDGD